MALKTIKQPKMENSKNIKRAILGLIVVVVGILFLMDNFNILDFPVRHYILSWKTLLIVIGIAMLASGKKNAGGIVLIGLGIIFWLPSIFEYQFTIKQIFWPSVLIIIGFVMLSKVRNLNDKPAEEAKLSGEDISEVTIIYPTDSEENK